MRTLLFTAAIMCIFVITVLAADCANSPEQGLNVELKRAKMLQHIDQRIALSQQEKVCVQAALSHADLISCREKFRPPKPGDDSQNRNL